MKSTQTWNVLQPAEPPPPAQPPMAPNERQQDNRVAATTPQSYHLPSKMKEKKLATRIRLNWKVNLQTRKHPLSTHAVYDKVSKMCHCFNISLHKHVRFTCKELMSPEYRPCVDELTKCALWLLKSCQKEVIACRVLCASWNTVGWCGWTGRRNWYGSIGNNI